MDYEFQKDKSVTFRTAQNSYLHLITSELKAVMDAYALTEKVSTNLEPSSFKSRFFEIHEDGSADFLFRGNVEAHLEPEEMKSFADDYQKEFGKKKNQEMER